MSKHEELSSAARRYSDAVMRRQRAIAEAEERYREEITNLRDELTVEDYLALMRPVK